MRPDAQTKRHVRCDTFRNRFEESEIGRAGQVPILGISPPRNQECPPTAGSTITVVCLVLA